MAVPDIISSTISTFVHNVVVAIEDDIGKTGRKGHSHGVPLNLLASGSENFSDSAGFLDGNRVPLGGNGLGSSGSNGTSSDGLGGDEEVYEGIKREHIIAVSVMLTCFSIFGVLGNGLVLYVFSRKSDRVTSTIFILALAWTDFFTCLVIMPFTVTNLQLSDHLNYTGFCKLFQFVITFGVPLSVFIMVAIAVDRYFSICRPFSHMITPRRAKISILCLLIFAFVLGFITSCMYSTYRTETVNETAEWCLNGTLDLLPLSSSSANGSSYRASLFASSYSTPTSMVISPSPITTQPTQRSLYANSLMEIIVNQTSATAAVPNYGAGGAPSKAGAMSAANCTRTVQKMVYAGGQCVENERIFPFWFMDLYQKIFISFYIISLLSVFLLYFFIYRSVAQRRKWRRRQKSCSHSPMTQMSNANHGGQHEDVGVTPDKVAALNNRGSVRSAMNNGSGQAAAESYSLKPWSHSGSPAGVAASHSAPNISGVTNATTSSTELGDEQAPGVETAASDPQANSNGKSEGSERGDENRSPEDKSTDNEITPVAAAGSNESPTTSIGGDGVAKNQKKKKKPATASGDQVTFQGDVADVEKASESGGHENGVGKRLTLAIPSAQTTAAEKKTSRERRDFNFLANIRTAMMLFVVTLVFTACFMPAWLMASQLLTFQPIVFYSHFLYNVANPVIYAFMNQSFRKELKRVFQRDCRPCCCCMAPRAKNPHHCSRYARTGATSLCESPDETRTYYVEHSFQGNQDSQES